LGVCFSNTWLDVFCSMVLVILPLGHTQLPQKKVSHHLMISISVAGFSLEYAFMNPSGYFFYSFYSVGGRIDPFLGTGEVSRFFIVIILRSSTMTLPLLYTDLLCPLFNLFKYGCTTEANKVMLTNLLFRFLHSFGCAYLLLLLMKLVVIPYKT
jgi:hypothetical protein